MDGEGSRNKEGNESSSEGNEGDGEGTKEKVNMSELFNSWLALIHEVSSITLQPWPEIWEMPIPQFFTYANYSRWKNKREADSIAKWKNQRKF